MRTSVWSISGCRKAVTTSVWSQLQWFIEAKARSVRREAGRLTGALLFVLYLLSRYMWPEGPWQRLLTGAYVSL